MIKSFIKIFYDFYKRLFCACSYYNYRYWQIFKWLFSSNETSNFTYELTETSYEYLAQTVSVVTGESYHKIRSYINEVLHDPFLKNQLIENATNNSAKRTLGEINSFGRRLGWYAIARSIKPKLIVETGVERGHGALVLNYALIKNAKEDHFGNYIGTDIDPNAGSILNETLMEYGEIIVGDSIETLKKIDRPIDLFVNDSDHSAAYEAAEYEVIKSKLSDKAIVLGDNSHVTDKLLKFSMNNKRKFLYFKEEPYKHWYPGAGIGISFK